MNRLYTWSLYGIFGISLLATLGSIYIWYRWDPLTNISTGYLFNRLNWIAPCDLCWYMRVFQYPIVLISWIWILIKDSKAFLYIWPLATIGLLISIYKFSLEQGWIIESSLCTSWVSCSTATNLWWRLSLPLLWAFCFIAILISCFICLYHTKHAT